jgi:four helix bundle protein
MAKFQTFEVAVDLINAIRPLITNIAMHDRDLADQLKRASSSIPLNINEGVYRVGRDRLHSFRIAAGSAGEVEAVIKVALAWGYLDVASCEQSLNLLTRVSAMLWSLTHPKR